MGSQPCSKSGLRLRLRFQCNALNYVAWTEHALYRFDNVSKCALSIRSKDEPVSSIVHFKQGIWSDIIVLKRMLADLSNKQKQVCTYLSFASKFRFSLQTMISEIVKIGPEYTVPIFVFKLSYCLRLFYQTVGTQRLKGINKQIASIALKMTAMESFVTLNSDLRWDAIAKDFSVVKNILPSMQSLHAQNHCTAWFPKKETSSPMKAEFLVG